MKDKIKFNTDGNGKADESAKLGADMDNARRAEWLPSEMQAPVRKPFLMAFFFAARLLTRVTRWRQLFCTWQLLGSKRGLWKFV